MKTPAIHPTLPIDAVLDDLKHALRTRHEAILEAPPGAGKTTRVPLALLDEPWLAGKKILILEPRRIAARTAAHRMASLLEESAGQTVGYRMRLDNKISRATRIEVITEGILTRMLQQDPSLDEIGLVIFDEFHERSLDSDLALSLCLKGRELFRDAHNPLKLLVMSATLDSNAIASLLDDAPVVRSEGRTYPVDIHYGQAAKPGERITDRMTATLKQALNDNPDSSILAFLPGQGEIHRVTDTLAEWLLERKLHGVHLHPMYGNLTLEEQQQAIAPLANPDERKVVLATNIAETSLTIEGVDVVVDSGLVREARFDPGTGMTGLHTSRISRASSTQRAGRAGRLAPGKCYRLWSASQQEQLAAHSTPEILRADLAPLALQLLQWGVDDPAELRWLDAPPSGPWQQALDLLATLDAIGRKGNTSVLTAHGQAMSALPVHPRLAHLLICGAQAGHLPTAAHLASLLSERNPFSQDNPDISQPLDILAGKAKCPPQQQGWLQRTRQLANQFVEQLHSQQLPESNTNFLLPAAQIHGYLLACAYPDRIALRRHSGGYQLANGRSADLPAKHALGNASWLAIAEVSSMAGSKSDTIRFAAALDDKLFSSALADQVHTQTVVEWDNKAKRFIAEEQYKIGALVLQRKTLQNIPNEIKAGALISFIRKQGLDLLPWQTEHGQWCARVNLLRREEPGQAWPNVTREHLLTTLEDWLAPYLADVNTLADFKKLDLTAILSAALPWELQQRLEQLAPKRLEVPSGHSIPIDYSQSPPVLAVKLQEMFGCQATPTIANGKVALIVHLLSPAGRPLQITQDLAGFWRTSYHDVKKDMKGRYPKHPWPDDPLQAIATRKLKKHL
ncbi:ATP-dependent helicase HrpB [Candidatus Thiothrix sp. Deng01]|uniref:ATP-dependent helicase HrpB n=1 Tax=Candidatus Thiothrix phosphatis TaxID=3112415 RepID=A0ABU6D3I1_9GAMM|nr:ATP-dependent helicase HrpB [Candidatus Thiothrix sp. Deng01]MEB4593361.1 ATP-dependent helicase HrpB [Candidatus Thiothrix sp. Deng01]